MVLKRAVYWAVVVRRSKKLGSYFRDMSRAEEG